MPDFIDPPRVRRPAAIEPPESPGVRGLTTLIASIATVAGLYFGRDVLIPITLAVLLSFLVAPIANFLIKLKLGRVVSVLASALVSLSVIVVLGGLIASQISNLAGETPQYEQTIETKLDALHGVTIGKMSDLANRAGQAIQHMSSEPAPTPSLAPPAAPRRGTRAPASAVISSQPTAPLTVEVREHPPTPFELARRIIAPVVSPLETTFIVVIVTIFILLQRDDLRDRAIRLFGSRDLHRTTTAMDDAARRLSRYFLTQLSVNAAVGLVIAAGLYVIGVPSPILWGILAALLRFVPYVGTWIAALLATGLAAAVDPGWTMAIMTLGLFMVVEVLTGQAIEPMLYGHSTGLSPFSVVVAAIFWSWIWGPIGLILSTPLTLCLVVLGRHVERLEFLDVLLGDRPALTPVENFYQRALTGDPDETLEHAEYLIRERSLSAYYDEVMIKGLQLAATDVQRGVVTPLQLERITATTHELLDGLESYADVEPAISHESAESLAPIADEPATESEPVPGDSLDRGATQHPVLCVSGRGPLDALAAPVLTQLLDKHGFEHRLASYEATSRTRIDALDLNGIELVCVFYLEIAGSPSNLRYLLRRLRERLPHATLIVGLWGEDHPIHWSEEQQQALGADHYACSLREMVTACVNPTIKLPRANRERPPSRDGGPGSGYREDGRHDEAPSRHDTGRDAPRVASL